MSDELLGQLVAALVGLVATIIWRLVDRYLPDETGSHPLPPRPGVHE
jgi:hypothetical protein